MAKPVTFEFEGKTYELSKGMLKQHDTNPYVFFENLLNAENPFNENPFDPVFTGAQWWAYEEKRFNWYSAAAERARKYKYGWRYWIKNPFIWILLPWLTFIVVMVLR